MQYTDRLHLKKPQRGENADNLDVNDLNDNFDTLDEVAISKEFIITMPVATTPEENYETITDTASKTYYKYTYTNSEVIDKFSVRDLYLGNETLLDNIENAESGYANVIKIDCKSGYIDVYIKEIPTNSFKIKVAQ